MSARTPPPCPQACWEFTDELERSWCYTRSARACGHRFGRDGWEWVTQARPLMEAAAADHYLPAAREALHRTEETQP